MDSYSDAFWEVQGARREVYSDEDYRMDYMHPPTAIPTLYEPTPDMTPEEERIWRGCRFTAIMMQQQTSHGEDTGSRFPSGNSARAISAAVDNIIQLEKYRSKVIDECRLAADNVRLCGNEFSRLHEQWEELNKEEQKLDEWARKVFVMLTEAPNESEIDYPLKCWMESKETRGEMVTRKRWVRMLIEDVRMAAMEHDKRLYEAMEEYDKVKRDMNLLLEYLSFIFT